MTNAGLDGSNEYTKVCFQQVEGWQVSGYGADGRRVSEP